MIYCNHSGDVRFWPLTGDKLCRDCWDKENDEHNKRGEPGLNWLAARRPCCDKFLSAIVEEKIDMAKDMKSFAIPVSLGGGCYILTDLLFCPFCGTKMDQLL